MRFDRLTTSSIEYLFWCLEGHEDVNKQNEAIRTLAGFIAYYDNKEDKYVTHGTERMYPRQFIKNEYIEALIQIGIM